jgi:hypothetical protein
MYEFALSIYLKIKAKNAYLGIYQILEKKCKGAESPLPQPNLLWLGF